MTAFTPEWRVKVNGVEVTSSTLVNLQISSGRQTIYEQPAASYAYVNLIAESNDPITYNINNGLTIEVKDTAGNYVSLFGGFISDVSGYVRSAGTVKVIQEIRLTAVGALARLVRANFTGNLASDTDGDQIYELIQNTLLNAWNEVPQALEWEDYDPTVTWANAENTGLGQIDRPGNYELDSQNDLNGSVYDYAAAVANSGLGYLYEDAQGRICYADSTHRGEYLATNGYVDLDARDAYAVGLEIVKRAGDVRNKISIIYGSSGNASVTDSDATSISQYGELAATVTTTLKNQADAESQAAFYLSIRKDPNFEFTSISFPLGNPDLDNTERNALLGVFIGMPVNIKNLPANWINGEFFGFVEGWTWRAGVKGLTLEMFVSPIAYSLQAFAWDDVPQMETWNTLSTTLDWTNATIVA